MVYNYKHMTEVDSKFMADHTVFTTEGYPSNVFKLLIKPSEHHDTGLTVDEAEPLFIELFKICSPSEFRVNNTVTNIVDKAGAIKFITELSTIFIGLFRENKFHGDFHAANILLCNDHYKIIDIDYLNIPSPTEPSDANLKSFLFDLKKYVEYTSVLVIKFVRVDDQRILLNECEHLQTILKNSTSEQFFSNQSSRDAVLMNITSSIQKIINAITQLEGGGKKKKTHNVKK